MSQERREQLAQQLSDELRGLEDRQIKRIGAIWESALRDTIRQVMDRLDRIEAQPWYDPDTTPGAFLGSTPDRPVPIEPLQKNQASLYLQGQLIQDLRLVLTQLQLMPEQELQLEQELTELFDRAQDLGAEYAIQLTREGLEPALRAAGQPPDDPVLQQWPDRERERYQEGQRFTRLFDLAGSVAAAERDFRSLAMNYLRQREIATDAHVAASKHYYYKWWRHWGETVSFATARQMAAGPDPRRLKRELQKAIPNINEAFRNRAETIARTESLMASGEAQERSYRQMRVGFVQYVATLDDRTCEFCAPRHGCLYWIGSVKTPIHPNCVLGDTQVLTGTRIAATRGLYSGNVVAIATRSGNRLTCTENHPVLTEQGWIPAHLIRKGMKVVRQGNEVHAVGAVPHLNQQPSLAKDVFESLAASVPVPARSVPAAPMYFHGDGRRFDGKVDVVWANRELMDWLQANTDHGGRHLSLDVADPELSLPASLSPLDLRLLAIHAAASGFMGRGDLAAALLRGHLGPLQQLRLAATAWGDASFDQPVGDYTSADTELMRHLIDADAGVVSLDEVIDVEINSVHGVEVFDFSTLSGAYFAGGLLTHNCRCATTPVTLESLALQNAFSDGPEGTWETEAQAQAAAVQRHFEDANGDEAPMRPIGGPGQARSTRDLPLMERNGLPMTKKRQALPADDPRNAGSRPWPAGDPVWDPRRGWIDPNARATYEAVQKEVREL